MTYLEQLKASKAIGAKQYDIAIDIYKKMLEEDETNQAALSMMAMCYKWMGDMETAIQYANRRLANDPTDYHMLLLAAQYWSENNNEDQTYNYACRALENVPRSEPEDIPKSIIWLFKLISVIKRFKGLESATKNNHEAYKKHYKENIEWARNYKNWYESKHGSAV